MKKALYQLEIYYKQNATESEKAVLLIILNNTREVVEMDIHTLAKKSYCSAATIVRICKKNGFKGFKELKLALINDINYSEEINNLNINSNKEYNIKNDISNLIKENITSIKNTYDLLDFEELSEITQLIYSSKYVYLFGIGASFLVAKDLQQKFERVNKKSFLYEDVHMQLINSSNIEDKEVAIIVSYSGLTKEIIQIANNIKRRGGIIIAITKYGSSKLLSISDYKLYVPEIESTFRVSASSSRISQLCVVDAIYHSYLFLVKEIYMDKIVSTNKLLNKSSD